MIIMRFFVQEKINFFIIEEGMSENVFSFLKIIGNEIKYFLKLNH